MHGSRLRKLRGHSRTKPNDRTKQTRPSPWPDGARQAQVLHPGTNPGIDAATCQSAGLAVGRDPESGGRAIFLPGGIREFLILSRAGSGASRGQHAGSSPQRTKVGLKDTIIHMKDITSLTGHDRKLIHASVTSYLDWSLAAQKWAWRGRRFQRALRRKYQRANANLEIARQAGLVDTEKVSGTSQHSVMGIRLRGLTI